MSVKKGTTKRKKIIDEEYSSNSSSEEDLTLDQTGTTEEEPSESEDGQGTTETESEEEGVGTTESESQEEKEDEDMDRSSILFSEPGNQHVGDYQNLLYGQRVKSFTIGGWPIPSKEGKVLCTPHELAMAGLVFLRKGQAKCVICHREITNLTQNSDPWEAHKTKYPKCPLIVLGKPQIPNGYTMTNFFKLVGERKSCRLDYELDLLEQSVRNKLKIMVQTEIDTMNLRKQKQKN